MLKQISTMLIVSVLALSCLNLAGDCETQISKTAKNPSQTLLAFITSTDCGATTSTAYGIHIIKSESINEESRPNHSIFVSEKHFDFKWITDDTIKIIGADTTAGFSFDKHYQLPNSKMNVCILYE